MAKTCKYYRYQKYVSYDGGKTYSAVGEYQMGYLYERDSADCGTEYERWVDGWMCDDCDGKKIIGFDSYGYEFSVNCNSSMKLTKGEIINRSLTNAIIGSCVSSIGDSAFTEMRNLEYIGIPSTVTSIGNSAFTNCVGLNEVGIPDSVTSIEDAAFLGCMQLSKVNLPQYLISLGESAFEACMNFDSINIPSTLAYISSRCFADCRGLSSLELPSSIDRIGREAFAGCISLDYIVIYDTTPPMLGNNVFSNVSNSFKIYVPSESVETYKTASGWSQYANKILPI